MEGAWVTVWEAFPPPPVEASNTYPTSFSRMETSQDTAPSFQAGETKSNHSLPHRLDISGEMLWGLSETSFPDSQLIGDSLKNRKRVIKAKY